MKNMVEILSHPLTVAVISSLFTVLFIGFIKWLKAQFKTLLRSIEMMRLELKSTDYAIEKTMGNGYQRTRREKLHDLIEKSKFINAEDFKD